MTQTLCSISPAGGEENFLPATLEFAGRCPARSDYVELSFSTPAGRWKWCFPEPDDTDGKPTRPGGLAITVGRYGAQAHSLTEHGPGPALPSALALPMILAGAEVLIARRLVISGH